MLNNKLSIFYRLPGEQAYPLVAVGAWHQDNAQRLRHGGRETATTQRTAAKSER